MSVLTIIASVCLMLGILIDLMSQSAKTSHTVQRYTGNKPGFVLLNLIWLGGIVLTVMAALIVRDWVIYPVSFYILVSIASYLSAWLDFWVPRRVILWRDISGLLVLAKLLFYLSDHT